MSSCVFIWAVRPPGPGPKGRGPSINRSHAPLLNGALRPLIKRIPGPSATNMPRRVKHLYYLCGVWGQGPQYKEKRCPKCGAGLKKEHATQEVKQIKHCMNARPPQERIGGPGPHKISKNGPKRLQLTLNPPLKISLRAAILHFLRVPP